MTHGENTTPEERAADDARGLRVHLVEQLITAIAPIAQREAELRAQRDAIDRELAELAELREEVVASLGLMAAPVPSASEVPKLFGLVLAHYERLRADLAEWSRPDHPSLLYVARTSGHSDRRLLELEQEASSARRRLLASLRKLESELAVAVRYKPSERGLTLRQLRELAERDFRMLITEAEKALEAWLRDRDDDRKGRAACRALYFVQRGRRALPAWGAPTYDIDLEKLVDGFYHERKKTIFGTARPDWVARKIVDNLAVAEEKTAQNA